MNIAARLAAIAMCAAALCPTAAAFDPSRLALMPLPRLALGRDAAALSLVGDSGVDSNADAARHAGGGVTAADLSRYGRITGYTLDYDHPPASALRAGNTLLEVQTIAELYRDGAAAARGLTFWRGVTGAEAAGSTNGVSVGLVAFKARVGDGRFAFELTSTLPGSARLYVGDIVFRLGDLLGAVFVTATQDSGLRARTARLADAFAARIERVILGKIHEPPVAVPGRA